MQHLSRSAELFLALTLSDLKLFVGLLEISEL